MRTTAKFIADETGNAIGFRQQLSTTSFELDIAVHSWTGNASDTRNLTNWLVYFLACSLDLARGPPQLRAECGLPLPGCRTIVPVLWILFSRHRCFRVSNPCRELHITAFLHHAALTDRDFQSESRLPAKFSWFYSILLLFRYRQFPKVK